jgi:hypothetical protein
MAMPGNGLFNMFPAPTMALARGSVDAARRFGDLFHPVNAPVNPSMPAARPQPNLLPRPEAVSIPAHGILTPQAPAAPAQPIQAQPQQAQGLFHRAMELLSGTKKGRALTDTQGNYASNIVAGVRG